MSQRFDIPQLRKVYANIPDSQNQSSWLQDEFSIEGKTYVFCKFAAGQYIRQGDSLYVNANGEAVIGKNATFIGNAVAEWDIDATLAAQYSLVIRAGSSVYVSVAPDSVTCVSAAYEGAFAVNYMNASVRVANASFTLPVTYASTNTATSNIILTRATDANASILVNAGDVVNTNVGIFGVIAQVINSSSIALGTAAQGTANGASVLCIVTSPLSTIQKSGMVVTCANAIWRMTVGGTTGYPYNTPAPGNVNSALSWNQVNVCTAGTIMFVNSCVAGQMVRTGDILTLAGDTGYSSRSVASIQNAYAFTVNAAATAETSYALGYGVNVNSKFILAQINPM
ncbi:MAG: hypothetical protein HGB12_00205 [Bacteroidetes bacterium]|nr:hypothetical protein [Bacteroidota bacterium]